MFPTSLPFGARKRTLTTPFGFDAPDVSRVHQPATPSTVASAA
jgi:hypothetical protein